jgi:tetratricopeptide (TPR) repeat protein
MNLDPKAFKGLSRFLAPSAGGPMADRALAEKLITPEQLQACIEEQDRSGRPLDEILIDRGFLRAEDTVRLRAPAVPPPVLEAVRDPARVVGHYILVERIGLGGMAEVWKAWDRSLGRWVAVKFLKDEIGHPTQRIEREGRMAGGLSHPGVISIYERGNHDGRPYLVMPFVDGAPPKAPLPSTEAVRLALEVARALIHAHQAGVIHRDVKPNNILLDGAGRVVLADFGLAIPSNSATSRWALSGTPEYASPEQVRGDVLDHRTDVYSLGATLYHLVSGRPPFSGDTIADISRKVLGEKPPALPGSPSRLKSVIARAMTPDRNQRYPTMEAFAQELSALLERLRHPPKVRWALLAGLLLVGLASSAATYAVLRAQARDELRREAERFLAEGRGHLLAGERILADAQAPTSVGAGAIARAVPPLRIALNLGGPARGEAALELGRAYELTGSPQRAEAVYREILPSSEGHEALARLLLRQLPETAGNRDWKARVADHAAAIAVPARRELFTAVAELHWNDVLPRAAFAAEHEPQDDLYPFLASWAALKTGRTDEARAWAARAVRLRRIDGNAAYVLGRAEQAAGDEPNALRAYEEALRLAPIGWPLQAETERAVKALKNP